MNCTTHKEHAHQHGQSCGHKAVQHGDHLDYLHDGHLHHVHEDHVDEHSLSEDSSNVSACTPEHKCSGHEKDHAHGPSCGHEQIPHGDHVDFLVHSHLHQPCGDHCDAHGEVKLVSH